VRETLRREADEAVRRIASRPGPPSTEVARRDDLRPPHDYGVALAAGVWAEYLLSDPNTSTDRVASFVRSSLRM
jgi:hypothetical protein